MMDGKSGVTILASLASILLTLDCKPKVEPVRLDSELSLMDLARQPIADLPALRKSIATYADDGRRSLVDLYRAQADLARRPGWLLEEIFSEKLTLADGAVVTLPSNVLRTTSRGPALWLLTGVHGEEPAGPNALAESLNVLADLERQGLPVVVMPLLNPLGYQRNWRYPDTAQYSQANPGASVGDSDHLLPDDRGEPRRSTPACPQAEKLTSKVLALARDYPPLLALDLHEDNLLDKGYLYSQGALGAGDPLAGDLVRLFVSSQFPILLDGATRFGEKVRNGVVSGVNDGSIDELLSSSFVIVNHERRVGPSGKSVLVVETSAKSTRLADRKKVHAAVIATLPALAQRAARRFPQFR